LTKLLRCNMEELLAYTARCLLVALMKNRSKDLLYRSKGSNIRTNSTKRGQNSKLMEKWMTT
jgi:hypothetical protein